MELQRSALEYLSDACSGHDCDECHYNEYGDNCDFVVRAEYLIANGVTIQRWIPVTEMLPEDRERVLVWKATHYGLCHDIVRFATCLEDVDSLDFEGQKHGGFYSYDSEYGYYETSDVTHWMPLPEAPKEG